MRRCIFLLLTFIFSFSLLTAQEKTWTLEECIRYAIEHNIQVKQQEIQTSYQENALEQSKMNRLPNLNGSASQQYSFGRTPDLTTYQFTDQRTRSNSFNLSSSISLFNGLQTLNTIKRNEFNVLASEKDLEKFKEDIAMNIALAYLQILLNKELLEVNENQLGISQQQIDKTEKMVEAGSLARGSLLEIQAQAANEEVQVVQSQNLLDMSYLNMIQLMELDSMNGFGIEIPDFSVPQQADLQTGIRDIYQIAVADRPQVKAEEYRLNSSESALLIAKGARSPSLSLSGSWYTGYSSVRKKTVIDPGTGLPVQEEYPFFDQLSDNRNTGISLSLNIPIFNRMQVNNGISNARLGIQNQEYALEFVKKNLLKNIQQAHADVRAAIKSYNASLKAVESMRESFRYTEQRFNVGMVTSLDYNTAKNQLTQAESALTRAKYEYLFKVKVLDFYRGVPLQF